MTYSKMLMIFLFTFLSLIAITHGECWTVKGDQCIFPFTYKGVTYKTCTKTDSELAWCATEVHPSGKVVNSKWEDCDELCPTECLTRRNKACVFPFTYKGEVHNQCTQVDSENGAFWCATKVDGTGKVVRNAWEDCQSDCPRECVRWVEASDGDIPPGAYNAGLPEYVVRAQHDGGIYPGTFLPQLGEVDIPWRGQIISKSKYQVLVENSNQNCELGWLDEGNKYFINKETFNRALVVGGHNESLTATFICKVNDYIKWGVPSRGVIGQYNVEEEVCYIPLGDKVYPFSGDGILLLVNYQDIKQLPQEAIFSVGTPPTHLSAIAGTRSFINPGRVCSNTSPCKRTNQAGETLCCEATLRNRFPSCRRVRSCQRLSSDSGNQGREETCITTSGASANKPCIFPFKYRGVQYNRCTLVDSPDNKAWCSTLVDSRGHHVGGQGKWGNCGPACPR